MKKLFFLILLLPVFSFGVPVKTVTYEPTLRHWYKPFYDKGNYKQKVAYNFYKQQDMNNYQKQSSVSSPFKGNTGATSTTSLKGTVTQTVPKKAVTSAVAKVAGKVITRGIPYVGQAVMAYDLYQALARENGYTQECEQGMCKENDGKTYILFLTREANSINAQMSYHELELWCNKPIQLNYPSGAGSRQCSSMSTVTGQPTKQDLLAKCGEDTVELNAHGACINTENKFTGWVVKSVKLKDPIPFTEADFMAVAEAAADKAIEKWIQAAEAETPLPWSEPKIYLLPGQIAQSDPYTNPETGRPEQARWKVVDDPSAPGIGSKIEEEIIARPDLTPNSPEAPLPNPDTGNDTGTGTGTGNDTGTSTGNDDKKQTGSTEDLCEKNPDILACDKIPDSKPSASEPDFSIPEETVDLSFAPDNVFPTNGTCPAPVSFQAMGATYAFSLQPACDLASMLRPMIIAFAWLVAAFFVTKTVRSEV